MDQSLDDIIKKRRGNAPKRGRGRGGSQTNFRSGGGQGLRTTRGGMISRRGRGGSVSRVSDARLKIIENKRQNIVDARDQLAQIAKQMDARDKLNLLRKQWRAPGTQPKKQELRNKLNQTRRGGKPVNSDRGSARWAFGSTRTARGGSATHLDKTGVTKKSRANLDVDLLYEGEEDYMDLILKHSQAIPKRTVQNPLVRNPLFRSSNLGQNSSVSLQGLGRTMVVPVSVAPLKVNVPQLDYAGDYYEESDEEMMEYAEPVQTQLIVRRPRAPISRSAAVAPRTTVPRTQLVHANVRDSHTMSARSTRALTPPSSSYPRMRQDWGGLQKTSVVVRNNLVSSSEGHISQQLRSRLDITSRPVLTQPQGPTGFKVTVSNLQSSVTEEDIKELFGDIGSLVQWRLLRPGIAEVTYKQRSHAMNAVDVYHKRQLDGQPMYVTLVTGQPTSVSKTPQSSKQGGSSKHSINPDIRTIHKALFKI